MNAIAQMGKKRKNLIGINDLTVAIKNRIWNDLSKGFILVDIVKRNNVSAHTIDFVVKERMRINRHEKNI